MKFSTAVEHILGRAGWTPDRQVDIAQWVEILAKEGFTFSASAKNILRNLGGLRVRPPSRPSLQIQCTPFDFEPVLAASGEHDRFPEWERLAQRSISPIGALGDLWILAADADGQIYIGSEGEIELLGPIEQALEYLCLGEPLPKTVLSRGVRKDNGS